MANSKFRTLCATLFLCASIAGYSDTVSASTLSDKEIAETVFSEIEKRVIEEFFGKPKNTQTSKGKSAKKNKEKKGLPPGLAKKKELPPGLARQLERNGTLPPGLAKRDLPEDLHARLPSRSKTYERIIVGADVLLIRRGTNLILDILKDIVK